MSYVMRVYGYVSRQTVVAVVCVNKCLGAITNSGCAIASLIKRIIVIIMTHLY